VIGFLRGHPAPFLLGRAVVGGVYVWYGWNKVLDPVGFLKALRAYDLLPLEPPQLLNLTVVVLPFVEIVCGLLLLAGAWLRAAGGLLLGLTLVFTAAVAVRAASIAGAEGIGLCAVVFDCGCGVGEVAFCSKLVENLGLILLAILVLGSRSRCLRAWPPGLRDRVPGGG
jgi:uncharacterized membrane protein YphA (DoxX/SURF4 family)